MFTSTLVLQLYANNQDICSVLDIHQQIHKLFIKNSKTAFLLYQIFEKENFFFSFNRFIQYFNTKNL